VRVTIQPQAAIRCSNAAVTATEPEGVMGHETYRPTIIVGVSGTSASAGALRWAADETKRRHGQLKVVLIWSAEQHAYYAPPLSPHALAARERLAREELTAILQSVLGNGPHGNLTVEVAKGTAERALVERSAGADLLVLGSASGGLAGRSIGPVVRTCLSRAHCPVVIVGPEGPFSHVHATQSDAGADAERGEQVRELAGAVPIGAAAVGVVALHHRDLAVE
jgi:nucleotide-binding universal stress UspA family protein